MAKIFKYSVSNHIYGEEELEKTVERLSRYGYDGIELKGTPEKYEVKSIREVLDSYQLEVSAINCINLFHLDPSSGNEVERRKAIDYIKSCIRFAGELEAPSVVVSATRSGKLYPEVNSGKEWCWAVESMREDGAYAENMGVLIAVEPVNRYRSFLINTAERCMKFIDDVSVDAVKMMLDCFHMSLEEADPAAAIRKVGDLLIHVHLADSNRKSVGRGHLDFKSIVRSLKEIGYNRYLSMEMHPKPDPTVFLTEEEAELYTEETISLVKLYERVC